MKRWRRTVYFFVSGNNGVTLVSSGHSILMRAFSGSGYAMLFGSVPHQSQFRQT